MIKILTILYKKVADGFILIIGWNHHLMTDLLAPLMSIYGLLSQYLPK